MNTVEQTVSTWGADVVGKRVHPTIVQALAPFLPRQTFTAPKPSRGVERFDFTLGDVDLVCDLEYTRSCRGARECGVPISPDEPESCILIAAYVRDVEIYELLSDKQIDKIECAFLAQREEA